MSEPLQPDEFLGSTCYRCPNPAEYHVKDGSVVENACGRHLTDAIESATDDSSLTVYDGPLKVWRLREEAP